MDPQTPRDSLTSAAEPNAPTKENKIPFKNSNASNVAKKLKF